MKVFVTGGSGYIGRSTISALGAAGHSVSALARNDRAAAVVRAAGAHPLPGGLADLAALTAAAADADAVIHLAQADTGDADRAAAGAMLAGAGDRTYVHTGGTWVYGDTDGVVDEDAPWNPPALVAWREPVESAVLASTISGHHPVLIRPGLLYGGDNRLIEEFYAAPGRRDGAIPCIGDGGNHWALVHVDDLADLYVRALDAAAGSVYVGVGGTNPTALEIALALSRAAGIDGKVAHLDLGRAREVMGPVADAFALDQQLTADRARTELGWTPRHTRPLTELADR